MQQIVSGYQSLHLLFNLNWDRLLYLVTIAVALWIGAFLGAVL